MDGGISKSEQLHIARKVANDKSRDIVPRGQGLMETKNRLQELLSAKQKNILKYINSIIGSNLRKELAAEEVLAETVRYVLEHPEQLKGRSLNDLFLFFLWKAKMVVIDKARNLKSSSMILPDDEHSLSEMMAQNRNVAPSPSLLLHREEKKLSLRRCLDLLSNVDQKTAIRLVRIEGQSVEEAGKTMKRSPDAVRKLVERGFVNLVWKIRSSGAMRFATTGETT